ncbi:MAG: type II secretion system F family protein [Anaerolineae bacterium]|nr:type II secretion system F family protein [Anaerolineae bacterium]
MDTALIAGAASALSILAVFRGIHLVAGPSPTIAARLQAYAAAGSRRQQPSEGQRPLQRLMAALDRALAGQEIARRMALSLAQSNLRLTVTEFLATMLATGLAGGVLGYALGGHALSFAAGLLLGLAVPWLLLERRRRRRLAAFQAQLVDVLVLMVGSLRSGHGLLNALELASRELGPPASEEFARVVREIGFGLSQSEALGNLVRRMETDDLQLMVTAINISHEVGGNLSDILEKIAETIRERIRLNGEVRVLTTQQRLTCYLLVALPIFLGVMLSIMSPRYMMGMFQPPWVIIPIVALLLELVGFVLAQRLTRIEV